MPTSSRSRQLTPEGVKKINEQMSNKHCTREALRRGTKIARNTINALLKPEPVLVHTLEEVCKYLDIKLDYETHVEPVSRPWRMEKGTLTSIADFPMPECMARIRQAKRVFFLSTWLVNKESLSQPLVSNAMERSGETRILILDPSSPHVAHRGIDLSCSKLAALKESDAIKAAEEEARESVHENITKSLKEISILASHLENCERLGVRVFDSTPTMTLLIVDGYVCQGFHWRDHQGSSMPHIEYTQEQNPRWYQAATEHFNAIWNSRTTSRYDICAREIVREP